MLKSPLKFGKQLRLRFHIVGIINLVLLFK